MATYAIGDIQGCLQTLLALLDRVEFDPGSDRLWLAGDLVNRGPDSVGVLRWAVEQGAAVETVLGNHDLHLLACHVGVGPAKRRNDLHDVLNAPDRGDLMEWLRHRPMLVREGDWVLVHAGLLPGWSLERATELAGELESGLRGGRAEEVLAASYVKPEPQWREDLETPEREASLIHVLSRLRVCKPSGEMALFFKGAPQAAIPDGFRPWYEHEHERGEDATVVFGHWSALGLHSAPGAVCLDSGCVWGRELTAMRLEDGAIFQQPNVENGNDE